MMIDIDYFTILLIQEHAMQFQLFFPQQISLSSLRVNIINKMNKDLYNTKKHIRWHIQLVYK